MRRWSILAVGVLLAATGCSGSAKPMLSYHVRVEADGQPVTLTGCAKCPLDIKQGSAIDFYETRRLPRTYTVHVGGREITCGPVRDLGLQPTPTTKMSAEYDFRIQPDGTCAVLRY